MWREAWVSEMTNNAAIIKTGNDLEFYFFKKKISLYNACCLWKQNGNY